MTRGVAQLASALAWGARGRKFESSHPDTLQKVEFVIVHKLRSVMIVTLFSFLYFLIKKMQFSMYMMC